MEFITGRPRTSQGWSMRDRCLAEALTEHEASLCTCGCGQKRAEAWDSDTDGEWVAHDVYCYAGAALERAREEEQKSNSSEPGHMFVVTRRSKSDDAASRP